MPARCTSRTSRPSPLTQVRMRNSALTHKLGDVERRSVATSHCGVFCHRCRRSWIVRQGVCPRQSVVGVRLGWAGLG